MADNSGNDSPSNKRLRDEKKATDSPKRVRSAVGETTQTPSTTPSPIPSPTPSRQQSSQTSEPLPIPTFNLNPPTSSSSSSSSRPSFDFEIKEFEFEGAWYIPVKQENQWEVKKTKTRPTKKRFLRYRRASTSAIGKKKPENQKLPKRFELAPAIPRFLQDAMQQMQRLQQRLRSLPSMKSPFYASNRQAYESCVPLPAEPTTTTTTTATPQTSNNNTVSPPSPPTIALSPSNASPEASEQARAFFSNLPQEVASQLASMISQFSSRAPPGSRVVLVVRPLPPVQQTAGRRKYQLQLRYVREGESINPSDLKTSSSSTPILTTSSSSVPTQIPAQLESPTSSRRATLRITHDNSTTSTSSSSPTSPAHAPHSPTSPTSSFSASVKTPALNVRYLLWQPSEIAQFLSKQNPNIPLPVLQQKLRKAVWMATNSRWPLRNLKKTVADVFSFLEKSSPPKWNSNSSLQFAIYRIELLRLIGQLKSALSKETSLPIEQEDIDTRFALFLSVDQKVKQFSATFGGVTGSCPEAAAISNTCQTKWESACSLITLSPQTSVAKPAEEACCCSSSSSHDGVHTHSHPTSDDTETTNNVLYPSNESSSGWNTWGSERESTPSVSLLTRFSKW